MKCSIPVDRLAENASNFQLICINIIGPFNADIQRCFLQKESAVDGQDFLQA